ncbi:hypothetical protein Tco_1382758, partial [Tanacetum coccineum]
MIERMTSKGKGVVIEEIMDHDVVGKEFDNESGNSGKLRLLEWNRSGMEELLYYDTGDGDSISGKEGDLKTWFGDKEVDQDNDVEWQDDPYHLLDEPEEPKEINDIFVKLD